jgi:geranylgeranyl pyrophosphate synthase
MLLPKMQPSYSHENYKLPISFFSFVQDEINQVENLIISQAEGNDPDISAVLRLLLASGGKRIRPTITLLIGKMLGVPKDKLITVAAAIEMLHTATLVHDDLIDSSLLRRGMPTLNSQWAPGATVLAGDFIFARAANLAVDSESIRFMKVFAQTLTTIVNGEITQLFDNHSFTKRADYYHRIYSKTASLFETSATAAAIVSQADEIIKEDLRKFGYGIGMAFQIVDDILDFTGEQATVGKPVGSDLRQGIITLPVINYFELNPGDPIVKQVLSNNSLNDDNIQLLVDSIRNSPAIQSALDEACRFIQEGLTGLDNQPDCQEKNALYDLADYIINRKL